MVLSTVKLIRSVFISAQVSHEYFHWSLMPVELNAQLKKPMLWGYYRSQLPTVCQKPFHSIENSDSKSKEAALVISCAQQSRQVCHNTDRRASETTTLSDTSLWVLSGANGSNIAFVHFPEAGKGGGMFSGCLLPRQGQNNVPKGKHTDLGARIVCRPIWASSEWRDTSNFGCFMSLVILRPGF